MVAGQRPQREVHVARYRRLALQHSGQPRRLINGVILEADEQVARDGVVRADQAVRLCGRGRELLAALRHVHEDWAELLKQRQ